MEELLKSRGVTTSAASLGVVLTANAVQAAPVGLAVTISTAAALAGTTATIATATATKTIAMTRPQKNVIVAKLSVTIGIAILSVVGVATYTPSQREPVYQGKKLSVWLAEANAGRWPRQGAVAADEAIRQIGTNAFPQITQLLRSRDSALISKLVNVYYRHPWVRIHFTTQRDRHSQAVAACYALGPVAKPLVPEVAKALQHRDVQLFAAMWLGSLGPDAEAAIPALVEILKDKKNPIRFMAAQNLANIAIHSKEEVLPVLHECLRDTNSFVSSEAGRALKILGEETEGDAKVGAGVR